MAVAFDTSASTQGEGITSLTQAITATGSNRGLFAGVGGFRNPGTLVTEITYSATSFFSAGTLWNFIDHSTLCVSGFFLDVEPATSSQNVIVTWGATITEAALGVATFTGVDQTTRTGNVQNTDGDDVDAASISVTCTDVNADDFVVDTVTRDLNEPTLGADQIENFAEDVAGFTYVESSRQDGADGGVMSWTGTGAELMLMGAVVVKAAGAGGDPPFPPWRKRHHTNVRM